MRGHVNGGSDARNKKHPTWPIGEPRCGNLLPMSKRRTKRAGGRPLTVDPKGRTRATERVSFVLTTAQLTKLKADAHRMGVPVSTFVRWKATEL
jgi:hypothetical protein